MYGAVAALVALVGVAVFAVFERTAQSQTASPALSARSSFPPERRERAAEPDARLGLDGIPVWWRDGQKIAFTSSRGGVDEVYVVNADGSGQRNLSRNPLGDEAGHALLPPQKK